MAFKYKQATMEEIDLLIETRIQVLLAANGLPSHTDMTQVREMTRAYYQDMLSQGQHCAYLVFSHGQWIGAGGVSFFQVMPTYHNPSGKKAYIMNMYTKPGYRRLGIAYEMLDRLVKVAQERGVNCITLEATPMGKPLYESYGFVQMNDEFILPETHT